MLRRFKIYDTVSNFGKIKSYAYSAQIWSLTNDDRGQDLSNISPPEAPRDFQKLSSLALEPKGDRYEHRNSVYR